MKTPLHSSGGHWRSAAHSPAGDIAQRIVAEAVGHVPGEDDDHTDVQDARFVAAQISFDAAAHANADPAELVPGALHDVSE